MNHTHAEPCHSILQLSIRFHHGGVSNTRSSRNLLDMDTRRNEDMLVAGCFNHGWNNVVNRLMTSVDNLEYHLAGFIAIQTIIFVVINKPGIHNLQDRRIGESGTKLLNGSSRHQSSRLLGTVIAGVILALEIIETVISPIVRIEDLRIIGYTRIIGTSFNPILLISCFTVSLRLISLASDDCAYNSSASHSDDGSEIRASRSTG